MNASIESAARLTAIMDLIADGLRGATAVAEELAKVVRTSMHREVEAAIVRRDAMVPPPPAVQPDQPRIDDHSELFILRALAEHASEHFLALHLLDGYEVMTARADADRPPPSVSLEALRESVASKARCIEALQSWRRLQVAK